MSQAKAEVQHAEFPQAPPIGLMVVTQIANSFEVICMDAHLISNTSYRMNYLRNEFDISSNERFIDIGRKIHSRKWKQGIILYHALQRKAGPIYL